MAIGLIPGSVLSLRAWSKVAMLLGVIALVGVWAMSTGAYSSNELSRDANLGVSDENGLIGNDPASSVTVRERSKLPHPRFELLQ